jgi:hypothetical protein
LYFLVFVVVVVVGLFYHEYGMLLHQGFHLHFLMTSHVLVNS